MTRYAHWDQHAGKKIFVHNYQGLGPEETLVALEEIVAATKEINDPELLIICDVSNTKARDDKAVLSRFRLAAKELRPYSAKIALVGLEPIQHSFMNFVATLTGVKAKAFKDYESAKKWLVAS